MITKTENPKGTLTLKEAFIIARKKRKITIATVRIRAIRDGFKSEHAGCGRYKFLIDEVKFEKWIKDTIDIIPKSYKTVGEAARGLNMTSSNIYAMIKKSKIGTVKGGSGGDLLYVDYPALVEIRRKKRSRIK